MTVDFKWLGRLPNHSSFSSPLGPKTVGQQGRRLGPVGRAEAEPTFRPRLGALGSTAGLLSLVL